MRASASTPAATDRCLTLASRPAIGLPLNHERVGSRINCFEACSAFTMFRPAWSLSRPSFRVFCQAENLGNWVFSVGFRDPWPPHCGEQGTTGARGESCEHLPGGRLRLPQAVVAQQGVSQHHELAHDGHERHLVLLGLDRGEPVVEGLAGGVAADRGGGGHEQHVAGMLPTAVDAAAAAAAAGVRGEGSEADQGGGLAAVERAQLGHVGTQAGGRTGAAAGDGLHDRGAPGEALVVGEALLDLAVEVPDLAVDGRDHGRAGLPGCVAAELAAHLAQRRALLDEL